MFFHSRREEFVARISGVTDAFGVTLLNRDRAFPLLVEEEEKTHGALLANTTHGALYRALGAFSIEPKGGLYIQGSPGEAFEAPDGLKVWNRIGFLRNRMTSKALNVHEAFSKYCAFCHQYALVSPASRPALDQLWESEVASYPFLLNLARSISPPQATTSYGPVFYLAYAAAKAVLNCGNLAHLLSQPTAGTLWSALQADLPFEGYGARLSAVLATIDDLKAGRRTFADEDHSPAALHAHFADGLRAHGLHAERAWDSGTLSAHAVLLARRIETVAPGIYSHLEDRHLAWQYGPWIDLDHRTLSGNGTLQLFATPQAIVGLLGSDPSLTVSYDMFAIAADWRAGQLGDVAHGDLAELIIYLSPGPDGAIDCHCLVREKDDHRSAFHQSVLDWPTLEADIGRFPSDSVAIVMLPYFLPGPTVNVPPANTLADALAPLGHITYLMLAFTPSLLLDGHAYVLVSDGMPEDFGADRRGPAGVFALHESSAQVTAAPLYAIDLVTRRMARLSSDFNQPLPTYFSAEIANIGDPAVDHRGNALDPQVVAAARVYAAYFDEGTLPGELPIYDPEELYSRIMDYHQPE